MEFSGFHAVDLFLRKTRHSMTEYVTIHALFTGLTFPIGATTQSVLQQMPAIYSSHTPLNLLCPRVEHWVRVSRLQGVQSCICPCPTLIHSLIHSHWLRLQLAGHLTAPLVA